MPTILDALIALENDAFETGPARPYPASVLLALLGDARYRLLFACGDQILEIPLPVLPASPSPCAPTGYLIALTIPEDRREELHRVGVPTELRQRGIGRRLLEAWVNRARADSDSVLLEVSEENRAAWSLYEALGFSLIGRRPRYYPDGSGARIYERRFLD